MTQIYEYIDNNAQVIIAFWIMIFVIFQAVVHYYSAKKKK